MRKLLSILLIIVICATALASCACSVNDDEVVDVAVLNGTTGFGMAQLMEKNSNSEADCNYSFSVHTDPTVVRESFLNGDIDIAAVPTNLASLIYNKSNGNAKILAINTLGVLYVVENGTQITSINDLEGKKIYCPANNPAFILKSILQKNNINAEIDTTYAMPADLNTAVTTGALKDKSFIAVLPEPMVTISTKTNTQIKVKLDLTEEWDKVNEAKLVQGCIIARADFVNEHKDLVDKFLKEYKTSIEYLTESVDDAAKLIVEHGIFAKEAIAKLAIPKCNIVFEDGETMKTDMEAFLREMFSVAPNSIGGKLPNEDFYYSK